MTLKLIFCELICIVWSLCLETGVFACFCSHGSSKLDCKDEFPWTVYCRSTGIQWLLRCSTFDSNWRLHRQSLCVHVQEVHLLQIYRCRVSDITNNILVVRSWARHSTDCVVWTSDWVAGSPKTLYWAAEAGMCSPNSAELSLLEDFIKPMELNAAAFWKCADAQTEGCLVGG
jgi:hypothetical protein